MSAKTSGISTSMQAALVVAVAGCSSTPSANDAATVAEAPACCAVVELRQYTLHPGKRDVLIELFEREFIEGQEAVGIHVVGQFRDRGDPDRFVWLRGFDDMPARATALQAFYGGPIWQAHRGIANPTMIDSDDVLLLRPAYPGAGFAAPERPRPPRAALALPGGLVIAQLHYLAATPTPMQAADVRDLVSAWVEPDAALLGVFVSDDSANNFPKLPVREGEHVLVWFAHFADGAVYTRHQAALETSPRWQKASARLARDARKPSETLRLAATARSQLY